MIKVLHMVPFGGGSQGGIETFIMNIYRRIDRSKIQFDFMTYGEPKYFSDEIKKLGGKIFQLTSRKKNPLKAYLETKKLLDEYGEEYQFLHLHLCSASNILPLKLNKKIPKVIVHSHLSATLGIIPFYLHKYNQKMILKKVDYFFSCSDLAAEHMYGKDYEKDKRYHFIPNAIDTEQFCYNSLIRKKIRQEYHLEESSIVIGFVGRLAEIKNTPFLIDILEEYIKKKENTTLLIVGDGPDMEKLRRKIKEKGLMDKALLVGSSNKVADFLQAMDIFVTASKVEGFPVSIVEAEAAGLPCVVSTAITKQVNIDGAVCFVDKKAKAHVWAKIINNVSIENRENRAKKIENSVFNIKKLISRIEEFYETERMH